MYVLHKLSFYKRDLIASYSYLYYKTLIGFFIP